MPHSDIAPIASHFIRHMQRITSRCGIHITRDGHAPEQGSFVVPGLGIVIVPLVYGDHHSWNLAYLDGSVRDVPIHRHLDGAEIHLGYGPISGVTVLGRYRAHVNEGYAMPIPPNTVHGWVNTSEFVHHVPFIFGSLLLGGWGVFLDVQPQLESIEKCTKLTNRTSASFKDMVYLEREIDRALRLKTSRRRVLIPHSATSRRNSGGLELAIVRIDSTDFAYPRDLFRIVSVVRGRGVVTIAGMERAITAHDHFGVPQGMTATIRATNPRPLLVLDSVLRG